MTSVNFNTVHVSLLMILGFFIISCNQGSSSGGSTKPQANFEITAVSKTMTSYNRPSLLITVRNNGAATGYNVSCRAYARNAANVIIDTASAYFAGLGNIVVGDSAQSDGVFFSLSSHNEYVTLTYECSWLTR